MAQTLTGKVAALSSGTLLNQLVMLGTSIVLARVLTTADFATYRQAFLAYNFAAPLLTLALPTALYYFLPCDPADERSVLIGNILLLAIMGAFFSAVLLNGGARLLASWFNNQSLEPTLCLLAPYPVFALPSLAIEASLVVKARIKTLAAYNIASRALLGAGLVVGCLVFHDIDALVHVHVVTAALLLPVAIWIMWRATAGAIRFPVLSQLWGMVKYSVPLGFATVLATVTVQLSNVVVSLQCTPEEFAIYSVGAVELPLVGIITGSITTVLLAEMTQLCRIGQRKESLGLFQTAAVRSASILFPIFILFMVIAAPFIETLYSSRFQGSTVPFRIYLLTLPVRIVTFGAALMALGRATTIAARSAISLCSVALLCSLFVWMFGYRGAALGLVATLYLWELPFSVRSIGKGFGVPALSVLPLRPLGKIFAVALVSSPAAIASIALAGGAGWIALLLSVTAYGTVYALLLDRARIISKESIALCLWRRYSPRGRTTDEIGIRCNDR